ncbi:MAG TPA: response regulator transcription factor [Anaerolineaceae bacterium]|nr:response regulator transcription factor [Anaerolineaceae bacterium]
MSNVIRIVVVDDHALFRRGLISLLSEYPEFQIVGDCGDGREALAMIEETRPDVALIDVNMPGMDGIQTVQELRDRNNKVRILMLTISHHDDDLLGAVYAGANGYLLKNAEPDDLYDAIVAVAEGKSVLSPEVTGAVLRALTHGMPGANAEGPLSDRELEVLHCLAQGQTTNQIGVQLFISENTVKTHIRHILEKLDAANRTEAVSKALQMGLIQREE